MPQRALTELLRGKGAHVDPVGCVEDISAEVAARVAPGFEHSIGQLVFHMNYWMEYELRRARGKKPKYPEHAAESWPAMPSPKDAGDWDWLREQLRGLLAEYETLALSSPAELERSVETVQPGDAKVAGTLHAVLWQMVAHNSYHTGQIAAVRRALEVWPPKSGGDTW